MKNKIVLALTLLLLVATAALAAPRSLKQAEAIALQHAQKLGIVVEGSAVKHRRMAARNIAVMRKATESGTDRFYVFNNGKNRGYTIVSGDDLLPEIVAYSDNGNFDESTMPDGLAYYMQAYDEFVAKVQAGDKKALRTLREVEALRASDYSQPTVAPLLGDVAWSQGEPYNRMAPERFDLTGNCVTGCVATAMAQVMMYHRWPDVLKADIDSYVTNTYHTNVYGEKAGERLDWENMLPCYINGQYNDTQANAVAKLMSLCGKAVSMDYGPTSGAWVSDYHMKTFFGYDKETTQSVTRSRYTLREWVSLLDGEMVAKRPVIYGGQSSSSGHEFVCDGTDGNGLYHINWGWNGSQNGFFDISVLNPAKGGIGSGDAPDGYNRQCDMIIGLQKDNGVVDERIAQAVPVSFEKWGDDCFFSVPTTRANPFEHTICKAKMVFANVAERNLTNVLVAIGVKNYKGVLSPVSSKFDLSINSDIGDLRGNGYEFSFNYMFPVGRTVFYAIYSMDGGKTWECCQHKFGPIIVDATNTELKTKSMLEGTVTTSQALADSENTYTLTVTNNTDVEYCDLVHIYSNTSNVMPDNQTTDLWITVPANSTVTREFSLRNPGNEAYVWVKTSEARDFMVFVDGTKFTLTKNGVPSLKLEEVTSNATPDAYEREKALGHGYKVMVPIVNDDKLTLRYVIANYGEDYYGRFTFTSMNGSDNSVTLSKTWLHYLRGGNYNYIDIEVPYSEMDCNTQMTVLQLSDVNYSLAFAKNTHSYILTDKNYEGSYFPAEMNENWFYVTGVSAGIDSPSADSAGDVVVESGDRCLIVGSAKACTVAVHSLSGQRVATRQLAAGERATLPLPAGIYIVGGKKVVVK